MLFDHQLVADAAPGIVEGLDVLRFGEASGADLAFGRRDIRGRRDVVDEDRAPFRVGDLGHAELVVQHVDHLGGDGINCHRPIDLDDGQLAGTYAMSRGVGQNLFAECLVHRSLLV